MKLTKVSSNPSPARRPPQKEVLVFLKIFRTLKINENHAP